MWVPRRKRRHENGTVDRQDTILQNLLECLDTRHMGKRMAPRQGCSIHPAEQPVHEKALWLALPLSGAYVPHIRNLGHSKMFDFLPSIRTERVLVNPNALLRSTVLVEHFLSDRHGNLESSSLVIRTAHEAKEELVEAMTIVSDNPGWTISLNFSCIDPPARVSLHLVRVAETTKPIDKFRQG